MYKIGFLGLVGFKVDFIDYWIMKINEFIFKLEEEWSWVDEKVKKDVVFVIFNDWLVVVEVV